MCIWADCVALLLCRSCWDLWLCLSLLLRLVVCWRCCWRRQVWWKHSCLLLLSCCWRSSRLSLSCCLLVTAAAAAGSGATSTARAALRAEKGTALCWGHGPHTWRLGALRASWRRLRRFPRACRPCLHHTLTHSLCPRLPLCVAHARSVVMFRQQQHRHGASLARLFLFFPLILICLSSVCVRACVCVLLLCVPGCASTAAHQHHITITSPTRGTC